MITKEEKHTAKLQRQITNKLKQQLTKWRNYMAQLNT